MVLTAKDVANYVSRFEQVVKDPRKRCLKKLDIAKLYREAKCFDLAIECAREYLKVNPKDHRAYNLLGAASEELEEWGNALKYYKRSVEIQRNQKEILIKIVDVYSKVCHDEPNVAKVWADKAETIIPCHPAIFNLRWSLLAQCDNKDFEEMEDLLAQELVRRPREPDLHIKLLDLCMEKGDSQEAYTHCRSLLLSQVFQNNKDWLLCSAEVFMQFHQDSVGGDENVLSFMYHAYVLCCLLAVSFKACTVYEARDIFQRLDEAASRIYIMEISTMSADLQDEFEVFRAEIRGQLYFFLALLNYKMAQEDEISWSYAARLACPCLAVSSSIGIPDKKGKTELIEQLYGEIASHQKSLLMMDKEFLMTEYETPDLELLEICDQVAITGNPGNFDLLIWIGISNHFTRSSKFEAPKIASELFFGIQLEVNDLENCSPFTLSTLDLEVFIETVIYSCLDRLLNDDSTQAQCEPLLLPLVIRESLCTNAQSDLWDAAFRLHTGKTWQASTSKLKSILQRGLETLRAHGCHGIDPAILDHIAKIFLAKADEIQNEQEDAWKSQRDLESYRRRAFHYADEALKLLEISEGGREIASPKNPLIPPLLKRMNEIDRAEMIEGLRMMLADAAYRNEECSKALGYLNGLFTADGAYKQAQIYRDLASRENHSNVEGLRSHLSFLRKSRDMLQVCLQRLDKSQAALCDKVQAEIDEIKDAIAEQSGISSAPSKVLDFRYSSDETEDESDMFREKGDPRDESTTEAKLALENSILHEQLAVRNHEFSVLASRIHKLEREMSEMRASRSTSESVIKPRQNSGVNTDESSSSVAYVPKDDLTSGSGNLTPRLEPEMSWDPFSPAPVFPVGFFSGLVDTIEKLDEETEAEVREANSSSPVSPVVKSRTPDMPAREESVSYGDEDASFGDTLHVEPLVSLTRKSDLTTGEENEEVVFKERAKLYRFHDNQWKERGLGDIKILLDKATSKARILMRREKVLKVCANHLLTAKMQLTTKVENPNTYVWCTPADLSETEPVAETFAIRFKTVESGKEFSKMFAKYKDIDSSIKKEVIDAQAPEEKEESQAVLGDTDEKEQNAVSAAPLFDFTKSSLHPGEESRAAKALIKVSSDASQQKEEKSSTEKKQNGAESVGRKNLSQSAGFVFDAAKFNFSAPTEKKQNGTESVDGESPSQSAGFVFDAAKFSFGAPTAQVVSENSQNSSPERNPFLSAIQNLSSSRTSPFALGRFEGTNGIESSSPIGSAQTQAQVSTPSASNLFQRATFALAESTPNSDTFVSPIGDTGLGAEPHGQEYQVNHYLNATAQGSSFVNNRVSDQAGYYQSGWESIQDRYYDAAYDEYNGYYDGSSFYQNDDYQNDGDYYTAEDIYYGDEGAYYSNSEQGFEYYDQERPRDIPPADSDANSDRLSQPEGAVSSEELVPHVVQMIDDDIFVTYVKKASFAQRARAARLLLPPNFYAPSSYPLYTGHRGSRKGKNTMQYHHVTPQFNQDLAEVEQRPTTFGAAANADSGKDTKGKQFLSFADLVKSHSSFTNRIQNPSSFSGAGSMLFTAREEAVESEFDPTFKPIVALKKKEDLKTGEEGYEDLFKNRAKLFRFDFDSKQWKERGVGEMKLSYNPDTSYCRVIMRRDQVLKLCANHPVMPDIELKPHGMSSTSWLWVSGADYSEGEPQMQQFAVKFKSKEIADEFKRVFQDCQKRIVRYLDELNSKESEVCTASPGTQLSSTCMVSPSRNYTQEEKPVIVYVKEPSVSEEEKASRLLLPRTFFSPPFVPPCSGGSGFQTNDREKMNSTSNPSSAFKEEVKQAEKKTTFVSFADLASSSSGSTVAFQSHGKGFFASGTPLFTSPKQDEDPNAFDPTFKPIVKLKKKEDLKTGEEGYEDLFKNRAKLFRFDFDLKQWKERGVGEMKLSYNPDTSYCRVIMRRDQVLKLCANHPVMPDIELKPHGMSSTSWLWVSGADYSEGEPQMQQFAVKFKSKEIADEFKLVFQSCQQTIKKYLIDNGLQIPGLETNDEKVVPEHKSMLQEQIELEDKTKSESDTASDKEAKPESNDQFAPSALNNVARLHEGDTRGIVSGSPWNFSSCFATNSFDDLTDNSYNATKAQSTSEIPSSGGLFSMPAFSFGLATTAPSFGGIAFDATNDSMQMKSTLGNVNKADAQTSESTTPQSAASRGTTETKPFGRFEVKEGSWECQTCMVQNDKEKVNCISCGAENLSSKSASPKSAGFSKESSISKSFGQFKVTEGSWECQTCMVQNDKEKVNCISCGAENLSSKSASPKSAGFSKESSVSKSFGKFKVTEGSWECQTCMVQNDKEKVNCISCGAENLSSKSASPKSAGFSKESSVSKSFGKFKVTEGSWECQTCMVQNDKEKDACISCGAENLSSNPSAFPVPTTGQNSSNFTFGNQPSYSFPNNVNPVPFAKPSFSMPLFSMGSASNERTENGTQYAKHDVTFKPPSFSFQDSKQVGNVESSSSNSSITLKEDKPPAGLVGKSGELGSGASIFGASLQPSDGILSKLWSTTAGPFKFGDSDVGIKATNDNSAGKGQDFTPVGSIVATPKPEDVSTSSDQPFATQSYSMTHAITPKSPESPSKEGGILCSPLVSLQRLSNLKTGEEEEIVVFSEKAKLYRYDAGGKEWKERGVGELKILQKRDALNTYRLVMRRDQIRKLCANHFLVPGMVLKGMPSSEKMKIWTTTADFADEEAKKETFAVRFKSMDILEAFESAFNQATITDSNSEQPALKCEPSESKVNDRSRKEYTNGDEEEAVKEEKGADENKVVEKDKEAEGDKGPEGETGAEEEAGAEEETGVEEVDVEVTGVVLPSAADQDKAEKLLLPKEFFNKSSASFADDTIDLAMSTFKTPEKAKLSVGEIFASPKVSLFSSSVDVMPQQEPKSPEKFSEDCSASFTPIVHLEKVATETGEESEIVLFCDKAKLYRYDTEGKQWKERGIGDLKILRNTQNQSVRIIMRRDQVKKVCVNHSILPGMNLEFMGNRKNTLIWFTHADYSDEEVKAEKFAARFKSELVMTKFKECFDSVFTEGGSELFSPKKTQEERAMQSAEVVKDAHVEKVINEKPEVEKQQEVSKKELDAPMGINNMKNSSLTFQSTGSFANVFSKSDDPANTGNETNLPLFQQLLNFQEPSSVPANASAKDTTTLQGAGSSNLFSFGKSPATISETGSTFTWPVFGNQKLFSIGSMGTSSTPSFSISATESQDPGELVTENVSSNNQSFGSFTFNWSKTGSDKSDFNKCPFSFSSFDNRAVESLSIDDGNKGSKNGNPSFSWGGLASGEGSSVFTVGVSKEIPSKEVEKHIVDNSHSPEKSDDKETYDPSEAIVTLERVESSSGEEGEMLIFIEWAKAYRFDTESKEWKERGRGNVKILRNLTTGQYRLVMRRDQVKKIAINHLLTKDMKLEGNSASKNSWIWFTNADFSDEVAKPEKLAVRFKTEEISVRFKNAFDQAVKVLNDRPTSGTVSEDEPLKSLEKLTEVPKVVSVLADKSLDTSDELMITYVKEPTAEEQTRADRLLLPSAFFAPVSEVHSRKENEEKPTASAAATQMDDSQKTMPSIMASNGLTFADLVSKPSDALSGFSSSPGKLQEFKGQGSVLFGRKEDHEGADEGDYLSFKPIVSLTKTETKTGEEEEEVMFAERCKLYRFDKDNSQWKERGVGDMKILYNSMQKTSRIIMRRDVVFKLGANHVIQPGMEVTSKEGRETTWMWKTNADFADEEAKEEAFTVKFRSADIGKKFAEVFEKCLIRAETEDQQEEEDRASRKATEQMPSQQPFDTIAGKTMASEEAESVLSTGNKGSSPIPTHQGKAGSLSQNSGDENDHTKLVLSIQSDYSPPTSDVNHSDTSDNLVDKRAMHSEAEEEKLQSNAFGSQFSGLDFSALAQSDTNAFKNVSKGGFVNAGAKLFCSESENSEGQNPRLEAIVQLEQVESKSGEENEDVLFENRVKLYRFAKETKEWKERGIGMIKLLCHRNTKMGRLVMRRDVILKIAANHALTKGMKLDSSRSSTRTLAWTALADVSDDEPTESMFAAKFKSDEVLHEFSRVFEALCSGAELEVWEGKKEEAENSTQAIATGFCTPEIKQELQNDIDEKTDRASK